MDLEKAISSLLAERDRISEIIKQLEWLEKRPSAPTVRAAPPVRKKQPRGRKSMSEEERAIVSARMREYWGLRRKEKEAALKTTA